MPPQNLSDDDIQPEVYNREDHSISRQNIDPDAMKIMYRLLRNGYKAYLVGGGVRDLLLDKIPKDFDIATDATPRRIKELFRNSRIIGRRFKLVHIFFKGGKIIEVSTFRDVSDTPEPGEGDGGDNLLPIRDNKYGTEQTDAMRRDITINGLFYDLASFSIIDYVGGMKDLQDRVVRVIGDPDSRFKEDPVRLIRVVRHAVRAGFDIEPICWESIQRNTELIKQSSQVRVYEELKKDLCSGYALPILSLLDRTGILRFLLPELTDERHLDAESPLAECLARADRIVRGGQPVTPTAILSLLAIYINSDGASFEQLAEDFDHGDRLADHLARCFVNLQVPRKEKERIGEIIILLCHLVQRGFDQKNRSRLARTEYLSDLISLAKFLDSPVDTETLAHIAADAHAQRQSGDHHGHRGDRGGRGGNRRDRGRPHIKRFM